MQPNLPDAEVIEVAPDRVLRHMLRSSEQLTRPMRVRVQRATDAPAPVLSSPFYLANIGSADHPLLLDLRFAETDHGFWISLLMTNERYPRDLALMASEIL